MTSGENLSPVEGRDRKKRDLTSSLPTIEAISPFNRIGTCPSCDNFAPLRRSKADHWVCATCFEEKGTPAPSDITPRGVSQPIENAIVSESVVALTPRPWHVEVGDVIIVRYRDHTYYRDEVSESSQMPHEMTAYGLLVYEDEEIIRLRVESYPYRDASNKSRVRCMGFVILKSTIIEIRKANA